MSAGEVATAVRERPIPFRPELVRAILDGKSQTRRVMTPQPPPFVQHTPDQHPPKRPVPYIDSYCSEPKTPANPRGMSPLWCWWTRDNRQGEEIGRCPYGVPGDRLWVREAWQCFEACSDRLLAPKPQPGICTTDYKATSATWRGPWRSGRFMPRWASRLTLEITEVRVQRLQEISEEDAKAEGMTTEPRPGKVNGEPATLYPMTHKQAFVWTWDLLNSKRAPWSSNPFVWCISFRRLGA